MEVLPLHPAAAGLDPASHLLLAHSLADLWGHACRLSLDNLLGQPQPQLQQALQHLLLCTAKLPALLRCLVDNDPEVAASGAVWCVSACQAVRFGPQLLAELAVKADGQRLAAQAHLWCDAATAGLRALPLLSHIEQLARSGSGSPIPMLHSAEVVQSLRCSLMVLFQRVAQLSQAACTIACSSSLLPAVRQLHTVGCRLVHLYSGQAEQLDAATANCHMAALTCALMATQMMGVKVGETHSRCASGAWRAVTRAMHVLLGEDD